MREICLRPFDESYLEAMTELVSDPDVQRFTPLPVAASPDYAQNWLRRYEDGRRTGVREAFAIVDLEDDGFVGIAVAPQIDREGRTAELGYIVAPAARGRGVASQALGLLADWAFSELRALRLELRISAENEASKRVARRCGFVLEGELRSVHLKQGLREDLEIWSRLPSDPAP